MQETLNKIRDTILTAIDEGRTLAFNSETRTCVYRTAEGKACFVGLLIPDENYDPSLERDGVKHVMLYAPLLTQLHAEDGPAAYGFALELQGVHDSHVRHHGSERLDLLRTRTKEFFEEAAPQLLGLR